MGKKKQMRSEVKGNVKNSIGRIVFAALAVLLQIGWILILMIKLYQYSSVISLLTGLFALVVALRIYGKHTNAAFKMPWIIVILAFPVFGLCIYGLFGHKEAMHKIIRKFFNVILYLPVKVLCFITIDFGKILIKHYFLTSYLIDKTFHLFCRYDRDLIAHRCILHSLTFCHTGQQDIVT